MIDAIWKAKFRAAGPPKQKPLAARQGAAPQAAETRQQRWKRLHPEAVRKAQAALMRKRRAA